MQFSWKFIFAFGVVAVVVGFALAHVNDIKGKTAVDLPGKVEIAQAEPKAALIEIHSPDGKSNLILQKVIQSTGNTIYSFYTSEIPAKEKTLIYETAFPEGSSVNVSTNTWSPNYNKYVFLKQETGSTSAFLVFNANGENFGNGEKYIDVSAGFAAKDNGFSLKNVTGWDSETLLHLKAVKDGETVNFWYEIPSGAVIRLASR